MKRPDIGDKAPPFSLSLHDGSRKSLSDYAGGVLLLYFYPKDDTPGCTTQAVDFTALHREFAAIGVSILGVSGDSISKHQKFRTKHDLSIDLGADEETRMIKAYGCWVEKAMYGKKYMGVERTTFVINAAGSITHIWRKVRAKEHAANVLQELREIHG